MIKKYKPKELNIKRLKEYLSSRYDNLTIGFSKNKKITKN